MTLYPLAKGRCPQPPSRPPPARKARLRKHATPTRPARRRLRDCEGLFAHLHSAVTAAQRRRAVWASVRPAPRMERSAARLLTGAPHRRAVSTERTRFCGSRRTCGNPPKTNFLWLRFSLACARSNRCRHRRDAGQRARAPRRAPRARPPARPSARPPAVRTAAGGTCHAGPGRAGPGGRWTGGRRRRGKSAIQRGKWLLKPSWPPAVCSCCWPSSSSRTKPRTMCVSVMRSCSARRRCRRPPSQSTTLAARDNARKACCWPVMPQSRRGIVRK